VLLGDGNTGRWQNLLKAGLTERCLDHWNHALKRDIEIAAFLSESLSLSFSLNSWHEIRIFALLHFFHYVLCWSKKSVLWWLNYCLMWPMKCSTMLLSHFKYANKCFLMILIFFRIVFLGFLLFGISTLRIFMFRIVSFRVCGPKLSVGDVQP
jgi:hypothetical protein